MGLPSHQNIIHGVKKMNHSQVSKHMEEDGDSDRGSTPRIYIVVEITKPMLVVHPPPDAAWPQASPRLAPWVLYVSTIQSLCG